MVIAQLLTCVSALIMNNFRHLYSLFIWNTFIYSENRGNLILKNQSKAILINQGIKRKHKQLKWVKITVFVAQLKPLF